MHVGINYQQGSVWRRWDPHLHAPGTLRNDQFKRDWEIYLSSIEKSDPPVVALGVTDYFCIETYKAVCAKKAEGRLKNVELIFPNVEMRLDIKTDKHAPLNIHLLFSPDDPNHVAEIERILADLKFEYGPRQYACTVDELEKLGRAHDPKQTDIQAARSIGANQFKTTLKELRNLFRQHEWMSKNCVVAVSGSSNDGTAGLQKDDAFAATRIELERFANIIFASSPSQRQFWLGNGAASKGDVERMFGSLKPCLHGSDAHWNEKVVAPDNDRYCWIKGDTTFEALVQAIIEPEERAWIGKLPPATSIPSLTASTVTSNAAWLKTKPVRLNQGLIAIIGSRGSGKTALADVIASATNSLDASLSQSSFLKRASHPVDLLDGTEANLCWEDGNESVEPLSPNQEKQGEYQGIRYLSQQFVENLCSASGFANELKSEIERVIFDALDAATRRGTESFTELSELLLRPVVRRRQELQEVIESFAELITAEDSQREQLPK